MINFRTPFSALGIKQCSLKIAVVSTLLSLLGLLPTVYFATHLISKQQNYGAADNEKGLLGDEDAKYYSKELSTTIKVLAYLELFHLIPMAIGAVSLLLLFRRLSYYSNSNI